MKAPMMLLAKSAAATAAAMVLMLAGSSADAAHWQNVGRPAQPVPYESLERAPFGPWMESSLRLIRSVSDWDAWMAELAASGDIDPDFPPAIPDVDFAHCSLLVVALGRHEISGWGIEVRGLQRLGNHAVADVLVRMPNPDLAIQSLSAPYEIVRVDDPGIQTVEATYETLLPDGLTAPASVTAAQPAAAPGAGDRPGRAVSWGELKRIYR